MEPLERLLNLRLHQRDGRRSPHKPLLALVALGNLLNHGSSALTWTDAETRLADLIAEFGPASSTSRSQSAAYPFTRLRSDGVWELDVDVEMDNVGPLRAGHVTGRFEPSLEAALLADPSKVYATARLLAASHFSESLIGDVLTAAGIDSEQTLASDLTVPSQDVRKRSANWRTAVVEAWDRQCAFCGYDGQLGGGTVGLEAAHVRWFAFDGPDDLDNGLALCALHHKLFDRGVLGLRGDEVVVSEVFAARTASGRTVYDLHGRRLTPRPGTLLPDVDHVHWHTREVFKGAPLAV